MLIKLQNIYIETDNIVYISAPRISTSDYDKRYYFGIYFKNKSELHFSYFITKDRPAVETETYANLVRDKLASYMSTDIPDIDEEVKSQESQ